MFSTETWAKSHGISVAATPPRIEDYAESCARSAREVASRTGLPRRELFKSPG
jgi:hypothetical protein